MSILTNKYESLNERCRTNSNSMKSKNLSKILNDSKVGNFRKIENSDEEIDEYSNDFDEPGQVDTRNHFKRLCSGESNAAQRTNHLEILKRNSSNENILTNGNETLYNDETGNNFDSNEIENYKETYDNYNNKKVNIIEANKNDELEYDEEEIDHLGRKIYTSNNYGNDKAIIDHTDDMNADEGTINTNDYEDLDVLSSKKQYFKSKVMRKLNKNLLVNDKKKALAGSVLKENDEAFDECADEFKVSEIEIN